MNKDSQFLRCAVVSDDVKYQDTGRRDCCSEKACVVEIPSSAWSTHTSKLLVEHNIQCLFCTQQWGLMNTQNLASNVHTTSSVWCSQRFQHMHTQNFQCLVCTEFLASGVHTIFRVFVHTTSSVWCAPGVHTTS